MKPIRIAFSGSGFKFPAHVGALLALRDGGYTPIEFAGTSGGSIVAALAASEFVTLEWMQQQTLERDWSDMLTFSPLSPFTEMGYCNGKALLAWMLENTGRKTFADLPRNLTIMASDVASGAAFEFSRNATPACTIAQAARASAAIPFAYAPVQIDRAWLMDGGMVNNIPVDRLAVDQVPRLGVQLVSKATPLQPGMHSMFAIAPRLVSLMLSAQESTHVDLAEQMGASVAFVETGYADGLDRNMAPEIRERLMHDGYVAVRDALLAIEAATAPPGASIAPLAATSGAAPDDRVLQPV
jgi:NTE family protein